MPCFPILNNRGTKRVGFLCVGNEPVVIYYRNTTYRFEWTASSGWIPVNRDGSERLSPVPVGAWEALQAADAAKRE